MCQWVVMALNMVLVMVLLRLCCKSARAVETRATKKKLVPGGTRLCIYKLLESLPPERVQSKFAANAVVLVTTAELVKVVPDLKKSRCGEGKM